MDPSPNNTYDPTAVAALDWLRAFLEAHCNLEFKPLQAWAAARYPGASPRPDGAVVVGPYEGSTERGEGSTERGVCVDVYRDGKVRRRYHVFLVKCGHEHGVIVADSEGDRTILGVVDRIGRGWGFFPHAGEYLHQRHEAVTVWLTDPQVLAQIAALEHTVVEG